MSAQRRRRANRMATRQQRLALGPVSEHAAEIREALRITATRGDQATSSDKDESHVANVVLSNQSQRTATELKPLAIGQVHVSADGDGLAVDIKAADLPSIVDSPEVCSQEDAVDIAKTNDDNTVPDVSFSIRNAEGDMKLCSVEDGTQVEGSSEGVTGITVDTTTPIGSPPAPSPILFPETGDVFLDLEDSLGDTTKPSIHHTPVLVARYDMLIRDPLQGPRPPSLQGSTGSKSESPQSSRIPITNVDQAVIDFLESKIRCPSLTWGDLSTFGTGHSVQHLDTLLEIGSGSYGRVLLASHTDTSTPIVIKQPFRSNNHASPGELVDELRDVRRRAQKEALMHQLLSNSPHFPKFWGTMDVDNDICLAIEFVGDRDTGLSYPLYNSPPLSSKAGLKISEDIVKGIMELHDHGLLHNDIKYDNILLDYSSAQRRRHRRPRAVITDFGMASLVTSPLRMTGILESLKIAYLQGDEADYLAPEIVLDEEETTTSSDVYSVGVILMDIAKLLKDPNSSTAKKLSTLGIYCRARNPQARPSLGNVLAQITAWNKHTKRTPFWRRLMKKFQR